MADPKRPLLPLVGRDPKVPKDVRLVGRYALGVDWEDSHGSIYPFEFLRLSCPCAACRSAQSAGAPPPRALEQTWPADIRREGGGLRIRWQDGHETAFEGRELRQLCRCALCAGGH